MIEQAGGKHLASSKGRIRRVDDALFIRRNGDIQDGGWCHPLCTTGATMIERTRSSIVGQVKRADWKLSLGVIGEKHPPYYRPGRRMAASQTRAIRKPAGERP